MATALILLSSDMVIPFSSLLLYKHLLYILKHEVYIINLFESKIMQFMLFHMYIIEIKQYKIINMLSLNLIMAMARPRSTLIFRISGFLPRENLLLFLVWFINLVYFIYCFAITRML